MSRLGQALSLAAMLSVAAAGVGLLGLWPVAAPTPAVRLDVRERLAARHAAPSKKVELPTAPEPAAAEVLDVPTQGLCGEPTAGLFASVSLGVRGEVLAMPCGAGVDLWQVDAASAPKPLLRVGWPTTLPGLEFTGLESGDVDGDGLADLLLVLRARGGQAQSRGGLYWFRGLAGGGFESPRHLVDASVDAVSVVLRPGGATRLAVRLSGSQAASRPARLLWLSGGTSPQRVAESPLPPAVSHQVAVDVDGDGHAEVVLLHPAGLTVAWSDPSRPPSTLKIPGLSGLCRFADKARFAGKAGGQELAIDGSGKLSIRPTAAPGQLDHQLWWADSRGAGIGQGSLWVWDGPRSAQLRASEPGRVVGIAHAMGGLWLRLATGSVPGGEVARLGPGVPERPVRFVSTPVSAVRWPAQLVIP